MNAAKKLDMLSAVREFSNYGTLTSKGMTAFAGDHTSDEKKIWSMFPKFSWNAKQAIQLALVASRLEHKNARRKLALLEVAKVLPVLAPDEILVLSVALNHGQRALDEIQQVVKLMRVKK